MIYHTFECGCWFACLFPCFFQESKFKKYVFKVLKIRFVLKFFLVHGRIFPQWELAGSLQLKSRHSFFPSWPCACCQTSLKKKKTNQFCLPWKSAEEGNIPPCKELCLWYSHSPHFDVMQISVGPWTDGNISSFKSSKVILGLVLTWPSDLQNLVMVSPTDFRLIDRKL